MELFRYVLTMLPHWNDVQDVMQETAVALWQRFEQYDPDRPFLPWACQFAYHQVLNFRSRQKTRRKIFSAAVIDLLADERAGHVAPIQTQREALEACLGEFTRGSGSDPTAIFIDGKCDGFCRSSRPDAQCVYKSLQRIRRALLECVTRTLAMES